MTGSRQRLVGSAVAVALVVASCASGSERETTTTLSPATTAASTTTAPPTTTPGETSTTAADLIATGESLAARNGCAVCHISSGAPTVGPEWPGLYGSTETLTDGSTVLVDDAYLTESIIDPNAKIVEGYSAGVMPQDFGEKLTDDDVAAIIAYIQSLG